MTEAMDVDGAAGEKNFGSCLSSLIDTGTVESHRYYLARKTLLEMLRDRGFAVPNCEIEVSLAEFRSKHTDNPDVDGLRISSLHKDDPSIKVAYFPSFHSPLPLFTVCECVCRITIDMQLGNRLKCLVASIVLCVLKEPFFTECNFVIILLRSTV